MKNSISGTPQFSAFPTYFMKFADGGVLFPLCFGHSTNIRLSEPLLSWRVGTPSLFFHIQHLKGGVLQHDTKTTDTAERTNCRI